MARTISSAINGKLVLATTDNPLTITSSGSVTATASGADAIDGGSGTPWSITNNGAIASSLGYGVYLSGTGSSVFNSGSISGQGAVHLVTGGSVTNYSSGTIKAIGTTGFSAIAGVQISGSGTINNYGTISAASTGYGASLDNGGTVTNSGSITGGEDGVIIQGSTGQINNTGKITATVDDGVSLWAGGSVVNGVGGIISAPTAGAGVYIPNVAASIQNDGSISGKSYGAYFSAGGSVTNGVNSASASMSGGSYGVYMKGGAGTVTNAGTISGASYAVYFSFSSASNRVVVDPGAVFNGVVAGGQGTLELASGVGSISGVSSSGSFRNFQNLAIDAGGAWTLNGVNNSIANVTDNGTLVVTGSLKISTAIDMSSSGQFQLGVTGGSGTLEVASQTGSLSQTNFLGNGKLIIDNAALFGVNVGTSSYTGPLLENFAAGDTTQILNFSASGATISFDHATGLAQISNGTQKATLDFQTSTLSAGSLQLASDGGTGISVTISPATSGPAVSSIAASGTGVTGGTGDLNAGKVVTLTVGFSATVTVNTTGGSPTLTLNDGGTATYTSGSGSTALTFSYTVAAGQTTSDLVVSSFNLNGATVKDGAGNVADLSGATNYNPAGTLQIDTVAPTIASIVTSGPGITNGSGNLGTGQVVTLTVSCSEPVTVDTTGGSPTLALNDGGTATYTSGSGSTALTFSYTIAAGQTTSDLVVSSFNLNGAIVKDGAGNAADLSGTANYNPAGTLQINTTATTVASIAASGTGITGGTGDLNAGKVVTLTVSFSAAVTVNTTVGSPTLTLNDGGTATYTSGSGSTALTFSYTVAAGQNTSDLVVSSFNLNGATVQDGAGNNVNVAGAINDNPAGTLQIDTIAPVPVFNQEPPLVTTSGAAVFAFTTSNTETNGVSYAYKLDGATTWTAVTGSTLSLSGLANGSHAIQVQATDGAGNVSGSPASYNWTITSATAQIERQFSGISVTGAYPPHNGLAVGPNNTVMVEGSRIEWTNLAGGAPTQQSVYSFFSPLNPTGGLYDPRCAYDSINQRYVVIMDYGASGATISNIDVAVSKDSNPNDGWYFGSLNTSISINGQLTASDRPTLSVDGGNIYITAPQYNVNVSGYAGTECWVIGDTAGAGGGIYNGGTMTVIGNQLTPSTTQGVFTAVVGNNGKTYYASDYANGGQIVVALQAYDVATKIFGPASTIALGNIDQGASYTAQQQGTTLLLDAGDKRIGNLVYTNGFLYGVAEMKPIGSSVPEVHWFKLDVSNPNAPTVVAQGDISGAAIGTNVATFNGSIAVDGSGDVIINFTASGPNMYPGDYYVYQRGSDPPGSFSAPVLYQASTGFFNSGDGSSVQRWGTYSSAVVDPNNPNSFWISNEYVANNWWQTSVAKVAIETAETPTLTIANTSLTVTAGGSVPLGITATPIDSDDAISVKISGVPIYESITAPSGDTVTSSLQADGTNTWTVTEGASTTGAPLTALTLSSSYTGSDHPVATFTVAASNTTAGETANSAAQTITVTDPPAMTSGGEPNASLHRAIAASTPNPGQIDRLVALMDQFTAAGFHEDQTVAGAITSMFRPNGSHDDLAFLVTPHYHHA